jgi:hypothetical protein
MPFCETRTLNNSINRTTLLAQTTVNALGHVNVISRRPPASVRSLLSFDRNSLGRADSFTQLASNAPLFASWISPQRVFASESWRDGTFLERVINCVPIIETINKRLRWQLLFVYNALTEVGNTVPAPPTCL